jgi:hypothetical protein
VAGINPLPRLRSVRNAALELRYTSVAAFIFLNANKGRLRTEGSLLDPRWADRTPTRKTLGKKYRRRLSSDPLTQVVKERLKKTWRSVTQNAKRLRANAERCLQIARLMTGPCSFGTNLPGRY